MSQDYEHYIAKRGGAEAAASIAYFDARLPIDTTQNQKIFRDGFERAYDLQEKELAALREKCAELERSLEAVNEMHEECAEQARAAEAKCAELQRQLDEAAKQEPVGYCQLGTKDGKLYVREIPNILTNEHAFLHGNDNYHSPLYAKPINLPAIIEQAKAEERERLALDMEGIMAPEMAARIRKNF